eukprot:645398-Rhodomonas_salina.1
MTKLAKLTVELVELVKTTGTLKPRDENAKKYVYAGFRPYANSSNLYPPLAAPPVPEQGRPADTRQSPNPIQSARYRRETPAAEVSVISTPSLRILIWASPTVRFRGKIGAVQLMRLNETAVAGERKVSPLSEKEHS